MVYDPRRWPREHMIALGIATVAGGFLGPILGWATIGEHSLSFSFWAWHRPHGAMGLPCIAAGALLGAAAVYLVKLLR